jgi:tRNA(His) guanylyltransferase
MAHSDFDIRMKGLEIYHGLKVPPGAWPILRIDGRGFSGLTSRVNFEKPFDRYFDECMGHATRVLMENLGAVYGYHQSDEISLLLPRNTPLFDRELEKLVSVSAGLATSAFALKLAAGHPNLEEYPHFDSRLIVACNAEDVWSYFHWRQLDATRNALNSYAHWTAIQQDGLSNTAAGKIFENKGVEFKNEFLFQHGINFNDCPAWQKRGTGMVWETYKKQGFNPVVQKVVEVERRRLIGKADLPMGFGYREMIDRLIKDSEFSGGTS